MKNTTKITKSEYHNTVVPAFVAYRKAMEKALNIPKDGYIRMFTEKRTSGARTKYWVTRQRMPNLQDYVAKNPKFIAGNAVYEVTCNDNYTSGDSWSRGDKCLYCKKSKAKNIPYKKIILPSRSSELQHLIDNELPRLISKELQRLLNSELQRLMNGRIY